MASLYEIQTVAACSNPRGAIHLLMEEDWATYLGHGVDRHAFLIEQPKRKFVLKIDTYRQPEQTEQEVKIYKKHKNHPFIPKIYGWAHNFRWIEMEYIDTKAIRQLPDTEEIYEFSELIDADLSDLEAKHHWGLNKKGFPKVVDFGY